MKKFVFAAIALLLVASVAYPQQIGWTRTYGGDSSEFAYCLKQTQDNGYVIVGRTNSFGAGSFDLWLLRTDSMGDTLWTKTYGGEARDNGVRIEPTSDSGYVIVGRTDSFGVGYSNIWLLKIDGNGDTLWSKTYGEVGYEANGVFVTQTSDSGYVIIGERTSSDSSFIWFIRTEANGDTIFTHSYGGNEYDNCISAQRIGEAGFIVLGDLREEGNCLIRLYDDGTVYWIEPCYIWEPSYVQLLGPGFMVTGCDYYSGGELPYLCLYVTDFWGMYENKTFYGGEWWDEGCCIQPTDDGCGIVAGYSESLGGGYWDSDLWLLKVDDYWGDTLWTRTYGGDSNDAGLYAQQTNDGGYIVLGYTYSFGAGASDIWLLKTDANGDTIPPAVEEQGRDITANWIVVSPVGTRISLRYSDYPHGFHASVFDATGRKVDELHSAHPSGTITWGENASRGVYFIRQVSDNSTISHKVVLIR